MSLIQPLKFRTWEMGHFKMPHLQMAMFQTVVTVASGLFQLLFINFGIAKVDFLKYV